jgi:hypothetical protein
LIEHHATDICALLAKALRFAQIRAIQLGVVRELLRPVPASVEHLLTLAAIVTAVGFQEMVTAFGERDGPVTAVQPHRLSQVLLSEVA